MAKPAKRKSASYGSSPKQAPGKVAGRNPIRSVLVVGGGSAGWMAAASLANAFKEGVSIELVESDEIGTVGVGEGTIPPVKKLNRLLGLDEAEFVRETGGTFKLGVDFVNWGRVGHRYFHPFGRYGPDFDYVTIEHHGRNLRNVGRAARIVDVGIGDAAAVRGRFVQAPAHPKIRSLFNYAYHFDAGLYANYLRRYSEARGVVRHEGKIVDVEQDSESGMVRSVTLTDGRRLEADLFVDCSGFRAILIEGAMKSGFEDWSHWLPCDSALAVPTERCEGTLTPYTRSTAHEAGWQWRIPLQHRTGNGHVFVSALMDQDRAAQILLDNVDGKPLAEPRLLRFKTGRRTNPWVGNVVSLGLAAGFLEPLESTSIYLVQTSISRFLHFFPTRDFDPKGIAEFNRRSRQEWEWVRDFIILHYHANDRRDCELWRQCADYELPDGLRERLYHFRASGRLLVDQRELFQLHSWLAVLVGQLIEPGGYHPIADARPQTNAEQRINAIVKLIGEAAEKMPRHEQFVARNCRSEFAADGAEPE